MKKAFSSFAAVFALCICGFLFTGMAKNRLTTVTGYINYYGNAPFAQPVLITDEGDRYAMAVAEDAGFTLKYVTALQGKTLKLEGIIKESAQDELLAGEKKTILIYAYSEAEKK